MDGIRACDVHCHGYVAQSVERPAETGEVAGSSPAVATPRRPRLSPKRTGSAFYFTPGVNGTCAEARP